MRRTVHYLILAGGLLVLAVGIAGIAVYVLDAYLRWQHGVGILPQ